MIKQLTSTENKSTLGCSMDIYQLRESLSKVVMKCANALSAFAASTKNAALLEKIGYTDSVVRKMGKAEFDAVCETIYDEATNRVANAGAFGYSMDDVTELKNCMEQYHASYQVDRQLFTSKAKTEGLMRELAMGRRRAA